MSRTANSIKNSSLNLICNILIMLIGFISQALFLKILDTEYLGVNGLFSNIISLIGVAELGLGSAIIYNLYKPIKENQKEKIIALLNFYKKAYIYIALFIFFIGILFLPFVDFFVGKTNLDLNYHIIFILFLLQTISTYIFSYKSSIFIASQEGYVVKINHLLFQLVLNVFQILYLYFSKDYYGYLIIKIIVQIIFNILLSFYANKKFNYLKNMKSIKLDDNTRKDIFKRIKSLFFHKIGGFIVNSTDYIIISRYLGLYIVGLYSNYLIIVNAITTLFSQVITSITSSAANLMLLKDDEKKYKAFNKIKFINYIISIYSSVGVYLLINPFISIWLGDKYLLSKSFVLVVSINLFQRIMRNTYIVFLDSLGIWYENRFVPLVESILNILFSIILLKYFSLIGVLIGTIISSLIHWLYSYPKFVYNGLFKKKYVEYFKGILFDFMIFLIIIGIVNIILIPINIKNIIIVLILNLIILAIIPTLIIYLLFRKNKNYIYLKNMLFNLLNKNKKEN